MSNRLAYVVGALAPCVAAAATCFGAAVVFPVSEGGNGSAYEIVLDDDASFDAARMAAAAGGGRGHLLTITSSAEQSFIEALLTQSNAPTGSYWLDLEHTGGAGFAWGTGEAFSFSNFAPGEPNAFQDAEDAAQIYWSRDIADDLVDRRGQWNDAPLSGYPNVGNDSFPTPDLARAGFIIEHDAVGGRPGEGPVAIPLPAAVLAAPLAALIAGLAARRIRRRAAV